MIRLKPWILLTGLPLLSGCSFWQTSTYEDESPRIAEAIRNLPRVTAEPLEQKPLQVTEVIQQLENIDPEILPVAVTQRLAQLQMQAVQEQLAEGDADFGGVTQSLQKLSLLVTDPAQQAEVQYQLARILDIAGSEQGERSALTSALSNTIDLAEHPNIEFEARFRRAELYFSADDYAQAELDFHEVAASPGEYQLHSHYMLTWVRFKLGDVDGALDAAIAGFALLANAEATNYKELKQDLLRVTVMALDYADGPESLALRMADYQKPAWQTDLYRALGDWYLTKHRFADSALTWQTFLAQNPYHEAAPGIALQVIKTQREAGFVADLPGLERDFIERYGKQSKFYGLHGDAVFASYAEPLRTMLDTHVQRLHARAQTSEGGYIDAAEAYELWLANFEAEPEAAKQRFLYAEVLEQAYGFLRAVDQFEQVVAEAPASEFAREAAYAIVLGVSKHIDAFSAAEAISVNLRFASLFPGDERAPAAQLAGAKTLFEEQDFAEAIEAARIALTMPQTLEQQLQAKRIIAHGAFELAQYSVAQGAYRELLDLGDEVKPQLLASIYKQGELAESSQDFELAIGFYQQLWEIDPMAELSRDTAYDVAGLYERQGDLAAAIQQLQRYQQQYPDSIQGHELDQRIANLKLASGDRLGAASAFAALSEKASGETSRVARYRAAELYLEAENLPLAIEHFRYYAHNFPEPVAIRLEAMDQMDQLYQLTQEPSKRRYWLRQKRDLFNTLVEQERTERARYLAADAIYNLSESAFIAYQKSKLTAPLARSLKTKQQLLSKSLKNYQAVIDVGVFKYVALSQLQMARHYEMLAAELLTSPVPKNLNDLEREQYQLLLEEQAYPFEELAIQLHEQNLQLGWRLGWSQPINESLVALQQFAPARFSRTYEEVSYVLAP